MVMYLIAVFKMDLIYPLSQIILLANLLVSVDSKLLISQNTSKSSIQNNKEARKMIHEYFSHENSLYMVQIESNEGDFLPEIRLPVVFFTRDQMLHDCEEGKLTDKDGYIFLASVNTNIAVQTVPLLKCLNQTTLHLKTKSILIIHLTKASKFIKSERYSRYFQSLWKAYGIANIAVMSLEDQNFATEPPLIFSYNPFLALKNLSSSPLMEIKVTEDVKQVLNNRFQNMQGHRLRAVSSPDIRKKSCVFGKASLGNNPDCLFKSAIESYYNIIFDTYEHQQNADRQKNGVPFEVLEEIIKGHADYYVNYFYISGNVWPKEIQYFQVAYSTFFVFIVPKPRPVASWQLFMHIFKWQVSLGFGLTLLLLSLATKLFVNVQSGVHPLSIRLQGTSEVISVWKAVLSASINRLPTRDSHRLLIALSLLFGLILVTMFCSQLFSLMKEKPRQRPITTLDELQHSNLPIVTLFKELIPTIQAFENTSLHKLKENFKNFSVNETSRLWFYDPKFLNLTDHAVLYFESLLHLIVNNPNNRKYLQYFETINEPVFLLTLGVCMPAGSIYYESFEKLNLRIVATGISIAWAKAYSRSNVQEITALLKGNKQDSSTQTSEQEEDIPLKYEDLKMAFYLLYIGLVVSALCFVTELASYCNHSHNSKPSRKLSNA